MNLDIKCYVVELDGFIEDEFMITNRGELLIFNKKGLETKVDKYQGEYYLMEFTGLKDSFAEKIYSSDVVETSYSLEEREYSFIGEIIKEDGSYFIVNDSNKIYLYHALKNGLVKIIGAKYDNKSKFKKLELINNKFVKAIGERDKKINEAIKRERINSIKRLIKEGIGKHLIVTMYSEEEFKIALNECEN